MANSAFTHNPSITVPSSTVNNRVVTWDGTTGKIFDDGTTVTINAGVVAGVTSLLLANSSNAYGITLNTGATGANYTITMPTAAPAAGKVLKTTSGSTTQLEWGDAGGGGNLVLIQSVEASTDSTIAITVNDTYDTYMIALASIRGSSNSNSPRFKFKNSSGPITSGYEWHHQRLDGTSTSYLGGAETSDNQLALTGTGAGNGTGLGSMGLFWFHRGDGLTRPSLIGTFNIISPSGVGHGGNFRGSLTSVDTITAIELSMDGGTLATGRFTIWGLKHD